MRYRVNRTYVEALGSDTTLVTERRSQIVEASSAVEAATLFISEDTCRLVGVVQALPGDEATATCESNGRTWVINVRRAE